MTKTIYDAKVKQYSKSIIKDLQETGIDLLEFFKYNKHYTVKEVPGKGIYLIGDNKQNGK